MQTISRMIECSFRLAAKAVILLSIALIALAAATVFSQEIETVDDGKLIPVPHEEPRDGGRFRYEHLNLDDLFHVGDVALKVNRAATVQSSRIIILDSIEVTGTDTKIKIDTLTVTGEHAAEVCRSIVAALIDAVATKEEVAAMSREREIEHQVVRARVTVTPK